METQKQCQHVFVCYQCEKCGIGQDACEMTDEQIRERIIYKEIIKEIENRLLFVNKLGCEGTKSSYEQMKDVMINNYGLDVKSLLTRIDTLEGEREKLSEFLKFVATYPSTWPLKSNYKCFLCNWNVGKATMLDQRNATMHAPDCPFGKAQRLYKEIEEVKDDVA